MDKVNIGLIGTGNFAHKVHFPVLTERDKGATVNSRERVLKSLRHETPDRVPLNGDFCPQIWAKLNGSFTIFIIAQKRRMNYERRIQSKVS